ncbi:hypothetical protein BsWGS_02032 [Bradybaena similaris]
MLINFALNIVGTRITSDKVSTDGYECSNLISSNWQQRRKGFMAESFIKPPVNITFEFPCNICIHHVSVSPCVGQQVSSHLELYSATKLMPSTKRNHQKLTANDAHKRFDVTSMTPAVSQSLPIFYPISKMCVADSNGLVCFYNPKVTDLSDTNTADIITYKHRAEIQHFRQEIINASSQLTLRIVRTAQASTAAVSNINIWGLPSLSVPTTIKDAIVHKYKTFLQQSSTSDMKVRHKQTASTAAPVTRPMVEDCHQLDIPEDFLDPITCEVMAVPMVLPCGKNVDQSTLDHYFSVEAAYGRQPRDPFTGVQFSSTSRPLPNATLKARIDKFLMEHSSDTATFKIARTVGTVHNSSFLGKRKHSGHVSGVSSILLRSPDVQLVHVPSDGQTKIGNTSVIRESPKLQQCHHSKTVPNSSDLPQSEKAKCTETIQVTVTTQVTSNSASCSSNTENSFEHSHETQLKNSLNNALSSILSCLPSHPPHIQSTTESDSCSVCNTILSLDQVSYVSPCHHYMCRHCLTSDSVTLSLTCRVCQHTFSKRDVLRRHHIK